MKSAAIVIFEDDQCELLRPAGLFGPLCDVALACVTLRGLITGAGYPVTTLFRELFNPGKPEQLKIDADILFFLNASVQPDCSYLETIRGLIEKGEQFITTSGNRVAAALVSKGMEFPQELGSNNIAQVLIESGLPLEKEIFKTIDWPHEIIDAHVKLFDANLEYVISKGQYTEKEKGVFTKGDPQIHPTCIINTESGPVVLERGVSAKPFTYLEGPIYIGEETRIIEHSAIKDKTFIGRVCKIGGEIEASVMDSYSNKQHHGFLGHSWIGKWVNLGAGTTTSDLKNTYGKIRMEYRGKRVDTDMQFLGSVIGDYAKTAVNSSLFTGKLIGVCSMVYGTVTRNVPSFTNYAKYFGQVTEFGIEQVLITQQRMFSRRGMKQTTEDIRLMRRVFELTQDERVMSDEQVNF